MGLVARQNPAVVRREWAKSLLVALERRAGESTGARALLFWLFDQLASVADLTPAEYGARRTAFQESVDD